MYILILTLVVSFQSFFSAGKAVIKTTPSAASIVVESLDGGKTWHDISAGLPQKLNPYCIFAGDREVLLGYERGLFRLNKAAHSPLWIKDPLLNDNIGGIFPGKAGPYLRNLERGLLQEIAHSGMWLPIYSHFNVEPVIMIRETSDGAIFVGNNSGLFKSGNAGKSWTHVYDKGMVTSLTEKNGKMIAATFEGLLLSTDNGEHWQMVLTEEGPIRQTNYIDGQFVAICSGINPNKEGVGNESDFENSVRVSVDGKTWKRMDENLAPRRYIFDSENNQPVRTIRDIEQVDNFLFCSLNAGIFRSADHGKTWELVLPSSSGMLYEMTVSGKVIYAIKVFNGC